MLLYYKSTFVFSLFIFCEVFTLSKRYMTIVPSKVLLQLYILFFRYHTCRTVANKPNIFINPT